MAHVAHASEDTTGEEGRGRDAAEGLAKVQVLKKVEVGVGRAPTREEGGPAAWRRRVHVVRAAREVEARLPAPTGRIRVACARHRLRHELCHDLKQRRLAEGAPEPRALHEHDDHAVLHDRLRLDRLASAEIRVLIQQGKEAKAIESADPLVAYGLQRLLHRGGGRAAAADEQLERRARKLARAHAPQRLAKGGE